MRPEYINVAKTEQGKGLSNVLYDEGIKHSKSKGYDGVLSGEVLLQPTQRRFNGPQMKNYIDEYNYPIKGMESPKDPNLSKRIIEAYNKANEYRTTVGRELLNMTQSLFRNYKRISNTIKKPGTICRCQAFSFYILNVFLYALKVSSTNIAAYNNFSAFDLSSL